jgi:Ca-activated chloride channel family protein
MITRAVLVAALTAALAATVLSAVEGPALSAVEGQDQQPTQFRAGVRTVPVYVSVRTHAGEFVLDLAQQDFVVLDNGKPQEITTFTKDVQPLSVVILIDGSTSVVPTLKSVLDAANQFIIRMMPGDKGRVGSFADKVRLMPRFSSSRDELLSYIADEFNIRVANATRLWDGIMDSLDALNGTDGRRVVLVLSDGFDTNSSSSAGNVMSAARKYDTIVYAVAVWTREGAAQVRPNRYLEGVATETGGGFFEMHPNDDMNAATTRISEELHSQYVIGFTPQVLDGKVHKLEVKLKQPDLLVVARKSYVAEDRKK